MHGVKTKAYTYSYQVGQNKGIDTGDSVILPLIEFDMLE